MTNHSLGAGCRQAALASQWTSSLSFFLPAFDPANRLVAPVLRFVCERIWSACFTSHCSDTRRHTHDQGGARASTWRVGGGGAGPGGQGAGHSRRSIAVNQETYDKQRETLVAAARAFRDDVPDVRFDWSRSCAHQGICEGLAVLF